MRLWIPALLLVACDVPIDPDADLPGSVLAGTVLVEDVDETAPTILLMSSEDAPMPPVGVGFPVTFNAISGSSFVPTSPRQLGANWAFTDVPAGGWYVTGIMDVDRNFHPEVLALSTPTCADLTGWHVGSFADDVPAPVTIGEQDRVDNVVVGPLRPVASPDPTFTIIGDTVLDADTPFRLEAVAVDETFGDGLRLNVPGPWTGSSDPCEASFLFERVDADGDGSADGTTLAEGIPAFVLEERWPRVILQWLGTPIDDDGDGYPDAYDTSAEEEGTLVVAVGDPSPAGIAEPAPGDVVRTSALDVRFTGLGLRIPEEGDSELLLSEGDLPRGAWGIIVISKAGQLRFLPNEMDPRTPESKALPPPGLVTEGDPRQGIFLTLE